MPRYDNEIKITPSVFDRLIDYEPQKKSGEVPASRQKNLRELKQSVKRDLEWLLNTRQNAEGVPDGLKELKNSLAAYGLPDFTALNPKNMHHQIELRKKLEDAIGIFEPRLTNVTVRLEPTVHEGERALRFRIDAHLRVEPTPEPVTFDTVLQLLSGEYIVKED